MSGIKKRGPFRRPLGKDARLRYSLFRSQKEVFRFMVQLEVSVDKEWKEVMRYDTAHGEAHQHVFKKDGNERKNILDADYHQELGYGGIMTSAEQDIKNHWEEYCRKYRKGGWPA